VATDTPDYVSPSTASVVQHKLGATRAVAFDLNAACAGFVTALEVGRTFVEAGAQHDTVVVASPYLMSRFLDYEQKNTATLFADGAAAVVLRPTDGPNAILGARLRSEGQYHGHMGIYVGGGARPARCLPAPVTRDETREARSEEQRLEFRLAFPEHYNRDRWTALVRALTADLGVTPADVDRYVFTQINIGSIRDTLDALGVPHHRAHNVMDRYGYTGSACIPMALADADAKGLLHAGDLVMLVASGGGAALACLALRWASR
jgi:3-oxoacyl-[acyl-carrier-protein] synthase-3